MKKLHSLIADSLLYSGYYLGRASKYLKETGIELHMKLGTNKGKKALKTKSMIENLVSLAKEMEGKKNESRKLSVVKSKD